MGRFLASLSRRGGRQAAGLGLALLALTAAVYAGVGRLGFVFDDADYLLRNPSLRQGFTLGSLGWALTSTYAANWHPMTWVSHLLDVQLFGMNPAGHHAVSAALHAVNAALLFGVLRALTGSTWRSWLVAALFAVHPLRVESVAWVSERKDVLSLLFGVLTVAAYRRYAAAPGRGRYLAVAGLFVLGLASKPMLVTLPFVLLLLDYWPLGRLLPAGPTAPDRIPIRALSRLAVEKVPLLCLSLASCMVTYAAQASGGALLPGQSPPLGARAANAAVATVRYLGLTLWPADLAAFYPYPLSGYPVGVALGAAALLVAVSVACIAVWRAYPSLIVGWLWFLGTLVPVVGIVQVGRQALADRYTYLPHVGLALLLVWGNAAVAGRNRARPLLVLGCGSVVALLALLAGRQVAVWRDDLTLTAHAVAVTQGNSFMYYNLGVALSAAGRPDEAIAAYREALRISPVEPDANYNLAVTLGKRGDQDAAIEQYLLALRLDPDNASAHNNLGSLLYRRGRRDEAIEHFRRALALRPDHAPTRENLRRALEGQSPAALR
jgi:hypothetical protein